MDELIKFVTFGLALLGAVLGIVNTVVGLINSKLRVRVKLVFGWGIDGSGKPLQKPHAVGVEVTNISSFPITVIDVGVAHRRSWRHWHRRKEHRDRSTFVGSLVEVTLPQRMDAREQATFYIPLALVPNDKSYWRVYAKTACGRVIYGNNADKALRKLLDA